MSTLIRMFTLAIFMLPMPLVANEVTEEIQRVPGVISAGSILQIVIGLFVVLVIIVGAGWLLKRFGGVGGMSNANLKVVAGITVGQREKIVIVQAGDAQILIGISPGSIRKLHVLERHISNENKLKDNIFSVEKESEEFSDHLTQQVKNREGL